MMTNYPTLADGCREYIRVVKRLVSLGMQSSTGGNISLLAEDGNMVITKRSGASLLDFRYEDLVVINKQGELISGKGKPTKEVAFHLGLYNSVPDIGGVVHVHPPFATAFACARKDLPLLTVHARRILQKVPRVKAFPDGSQELAAHVVEAFQEPAVKAALLEEHGLVGVGKDLSAAENIVELVEETAKTAFYTMFLLSAE